MKQLARKFRPLSLVPPSADSHESSEQPAHDSLEDHFEGWLNSVAPTVLSVGNLTQKATATPHAHRPLTSVDILRVHRATVRESREHRHWPPDVVEKLMATKIITRKR
jgi:hypothetical protein